MAKAGKILIFITLLLQWKCATKYDEVAPDTELSITVKDEAGQLLDQAEIFVYSDAAAFEQTTLTGIPASFVLQGTTTNGVVAITGVPYNTTLYIYSTYKDMVTFPGTYITLDNSDDNYALKNPLERGSVTSVHIVLKPAEGFITFWTAGTNSLSLPIDVFMGINEAALTSTATGAPGLFQPNGLTVRTRKGNIKFEGKSQAGCLWTDQIAVAGAQSVTYQLKDCVVGTIAFYTDNTNASKLPITMMLNANDPISNIAVVVSSVPADCSAVNLSVAYRVPGNYTYQAISASGACNWSDSFSLSANECKLIYLATCP